MQIEITIDGIDEEVLAKARDYANSLGKTVEQLIVEFLTDFATDPQFDKPVKKSGNRQRG